jgi:hypothetical protein
VRDGLLTDLHVALQGELPARPGLLAALAALAAIGGQAATVGGGSPPPCPISKRHCS